MSRRRQPRTLERVPCELCGRTIARALGGVVDLPLAHKCPHGALCRARVIGVTVREPLCVDCHAEWRRRGGGGPP